MNEQNKKSVSIEPFLLIIQILHKLRINLQEYILEKLKLQMFSDKGQDL